MVTAPVNAAMVTVGLVPVAVELHPDWTLLAIAAGITGAAAIVFRSLPAFRFTALTAPASFMRQRGAAIGSPRFRLGRALIAIQVAASIPLAAAGGLFSRTDQDSAR